MSAAIDGPNWSHGSAAAEIGTTAWADYVRLQVVAMVEHLGEDDEQLAGWFDFIKQHRAWSLMNKKEGGFFGSIEEFCAYKRPWGLGTPWSKIRPFVEVGLLKRGKSQGEVERTLQLETVPEASAPKAGPGRGHTSSDNKTEGHGVPSFAESVPAMDEKMAKRLRAINRAPDVVKDAYREGRISQTLAAKLGPKDPTPELAAKVAEVAGEIRKVKERTDVDRIVRARLGEEKPGLVHQAIKLVKKMSVDERREFFVSARDLESV